MSEQDNLLNLRNEIKQVTIEILDLISKRNQLSKKVGNIKKNSKLPIDDLTVENNLVKVVKERSKELNINPKLSLRLLNLLVRESKYNQSNIIKKKLSPLEMIKKAKQYEKKGIDIIHLESGDSDFPPSNKILDAAKTSLYSGETKYTDPSGISQLRENIASNLNEQYNLDLNKENVLITHGARFALFLAVATKISPGDSALYFEPAYPAYRKIIEYFEGRSIAIPTRLENNWEPDIKSVFNQLTDPPNIVILNSPNNPSGKILNKKIFDSITKYAKNNNVTIISDEVYSEYAFTPFQSILNYMDCDPIFISSFSKSHSMTGFRIGYVVSSKKNILKMAEIESLALTCISEFIQRSALKAIECKEDVRKNVSTIKSRSKFLCKLLDDLNVSYYRPDGGFYVFLKINKSNFDSEKFSINLLKNHHVSVVPGNIFGDYNDFIRISLCQPENKLKEAITKIEIALK